MADVLNGCAGLHPTVFQSGGCAEWLRRRVCAQLPFYTVSAGGGCAEWIALKGRSRKGSRLTVFPDGRLVRMVVPKGLRPTVFQTVSTRSGCAECIALQGRCCKGSCPTVFPDVRRRVVVPNGCADGFPPNNIQCVKMTKFYDFQPNLPTRPTKDLKIEYGLWCKSLPEH